MKLLQYGQVDDVLRKLLAEVNPPSLRLILAEFLSDDISPSIALMYLLVETRSLEKVGLIMSTLAAGMDVLGLTTTHKPALEELERLIRENRPGCTLITDMLRSGMDTDEPAKSVEEGIAFCKRLFDWSVQQCPEASVALYSLGNPEILAAATCEIITRMQEWGLICPDRTALEIGCGIGRFQDALAPQLKQVTGIDVSANMIAAAKTRCAGLTNVNLLECSGYDLAQFPGGSFDLVFAVDSFPYLCQSGMALVETHFHEAARVLRAQGHFLILNFSYRDDLRADCNDVQQLAADAGFNVCFNGERPFTLWDGTAFLLRLRP